jgi:hypothetical protein
MIICALWSGNRHLEVEEICHIPLFEKTLKKKTTTYGHPGVLEFISLLTYVHGIPIKLSGPMTQRTRKGN